MVLRDSAYLTSVRGTPKGQLRLLSVYAAFGGVVRYTSFMHGIWIGVSAEIWLVMAVNQPVWLVVTGGALQMVGSKKLSCDWDEFSLCS